MSGTERPEDMTLDTVCLKAGQFSSLHFNAAHRVMLYVRNAALLETPADVDALIVELEAMRATVTLPSVALIADVRLARGNNRQEFEARLVPIMAKLHMRFARFITLTASVAGKLQTQRLSRRIGRTHFVTTSMSEAIEWACSVDDDASG